MKIKKISAVLIWSENYKKLADWYKKRLGGGVIEEIKHANDTGVGLSIGESYLWVGKHSQVKGASKDPYRIMFNLSVDSVEQAYKELKNKGVEFIALDAEGLDLNGRFDLITANACFQWFQDLGAALKTYKGMLKDGGLILFSVFGQFLKYIFLLYHQESRI